MARETELIEIAIEHPMEDVLGIEPGTTLVDTQKSTTELVVVEEYDEKDDEIEGQFQEVYDAAMDAYEGSTDGDIQDIEPKYRARNMEVAVQYLNTALNAAKMKSDVKMHKDKLGASTKNKPGGAKTVNNNLIVDRNDLLRAMGRKPTETIIEGETSESS